MKFILPDHFFVKFSMWRRAELSVEKKQRLKQKPAVLSGVSRGVDESFNCPYIWSLLYISNFWNNVMFQIITQYIG